MLETSLFIASIAILGMLSPGPDFFLVFKNAVQYPRNTAIMTACGVIAGVATHMTYCVAGLAMIIATTPGLFTLLKYSGAAYLFWIGIKAIISRRNNKTNTDNPCSQQITFKNAFLQGYLCNLLNPKATLFFLAIFSQVLELNSSMTEKMWYASIIVILSAFWWPVFVLLIQSPPIRYRLIKIQNIIDKLLGCVLITLGIKIAFS